MHFCQPYRFTFDIYRIASVNWTASNTYVFNNEIQYSKLDMDMCFISLFYCLQNLIKREYPVRSKGFYSIHAHFILKCMGGLVYFRVLVVNSKVTLSSQYRSWLELAPQSFV